MIFSQSSLSSASPIFNVWDYPFLCEITFPIFFVQTILLAFSLSLHHMGYVSFPVLSLNRDIHHYSVFFLLLLLHFIHPVTFKVFLVVSPASSGLPLDRMNRAWGIKFKQHWIQIPVLSPMAAGPWTN